MALGLVGRDEPAASLNPPPVFQCPPSGSSHNPLDPVTVTRSDTRTQNAEAVQSSTGAGCAPDLAGCGRYRRRGQRTSASRLSDSFINSIYACGVF